MKHKAGTIVVFETGEYSDFSTDGPFKVLRDFDTREAADEGIAQHKHEGDWDRFGPYELVPYLVSAGYVEEIPHVNEHIGNYGELEITA
jgi:hypothetical protein